MDHRDKIQIDEDVDKDTIITVYITLHLSHIEDLIHDKGKQLWGWGEKKSVAYKKARKMWFVTKKEIVHFFYTYTTRIKNYWKWNKIRPHFFVYTTKIPEKIVNR